MDVKLNTKIDSAEEIAKLKEEYDALFISIGAHKDKKVGLENEDAEGVISAVDLLKAIGDDRYPDYKGKQVLVIGGGNVAMDCTRTSVRAGADKVSVVYRRRIADMTALQEEIFGAQAEGAEILELVAPTRIEKDETGKLKGLWVKQQMISRYKRGRPAPADAGEDEYMIPCDILVIAIGQGIESEPFAEFGLPTKWDQIAADDYTIVQDKPGIFSGGDCATGPATVIRAIAAGKTAAANIDEFLGYNHQIESGVEVPPVTTYDRHHCGRVNLREREAVVRNKNFEPFEYGMTDKEAMQEARRCLRCDHFGIGCFRGGRNFKW